MASSTDSKPVVSKKGRTWKLCGRMRKAEMINIPAILQNYDSSDVDLIMTISTPCLAGACSNVKHKKVVFTCVSDPIAAGAGKSRTDHLPFVTGVGSFPPVSHMLDFMQKLVPGLRAVGTMYNPAEANSVKEQAVAREVFQKRGIRLEQIAVSRIERSPASGADSGWTRYPGGVVARPTIPVFRDMKAR